jgi:putative peptide zinc metalloprotease protein
MAETHGKLRSDLEIRSGLNSGVIVKDPVTRRFYRFTPVQGSVLELLDGRTDFDSIARTASEKHQTEVTQEQVREFTGKLQSLLLLDDPFCWARLENVAPKKKPIIRNLLSIKIHAFNPDRLLARLEKRLRFCFSAPFSCLVGGAVLISLLISISNWESLFGSIGSLFTLYSIPLVIVLMFLIMTTHEFAHGITLKHFGGRVEEMGFLLLYFIPAFYCNVSDAWMLRKRERIWVTLAGSYIQFFIWALATIGWRLLSADTLCSRVCLITIAFTGIQTFFNFNPLIRLDGYYLLSDIIEVPNLRPKALRYIKKRFESVLTGVRTEGEDGLSRREKRLYLFYGMASSLFTICLVGFVFERLGTWAISEFRLWGALLVSTLFLMAVPIASKENVAASGKLVQSMAMRARRNPWLFLVPAALVIVALLPWELKVSADFTIVAMKRVSITPEVAGNLKKINVEQGSRVAADDVLAEIENLELANDYEETKGELASQAALLDLLKAGSRPEEIERARRTIETRRAELRSITRVDQERAVLRETVAKRESELDNARLNYERTQSLLQSGLVAKNEADRDRTRFEVAQKELSEAKGQLSILEEQIDRNRDIKRKELAQAESDLKILLAGSRKESIRSTESQVNKLKEKLGILERRMELLKIRSPIGGVVATSYLHDRIGDFLDKGSVFCEVVEQDTVIVEMPVPEKEIGDVQLGFPITIKVRGYPKRWYQARVRSIAPVAEVNGTDKTVIVKGELQNPDGSLKAGMTGVGKILCGKRMIFEIATRRAVRWIRTEFWQYLP